MMGIVMKFFKYIIITLVLSAILTNLLGLLYELSYPILPDAIIQKIGGQNTSLFSPFSKGNKPYLKSLAELLYSLSFFFISFKLYKHNNWVTNIIIGAFMFMGVAMLAVIAKNEVVDTICLVLPPTLAIILILTGVIKKGQWKVVSKRKTKRSDDGFVFRTKQGNIYLNNPYTGIYIQGGAGSGKSVSVFEPIISQLAEKEFTGLLYDFKSPQLSSKIMSLYQGNKNIRSYMVDFKNPFISHRVNPIAPEYLLKTAYALEYSTVLINNLLPETVKKGFDFWSGNSRMILSGVIWYLRNSYPKYCTLPHTISLLLHTDIDKLINEISTDYEAGGMVASLKQAIDRGAEKQVAGVLSTIQNSLSQLNTPDIFWILSGNDFDLHLNSTLNPKFLCLGNDSTLASTYAPVISLIISVAMRLMNQPDQQRSVLLLDESPTISIPNIEQIPATARSNKVATVFGVQDYSQLVDKYGQDKAQVILSNLGNQFYGRTINEKSATMVKNLFGKHDKTYETANTGSGSSGEFVHLSSNTNKGTSESIQERDRVKISDIINMNAGQFYGLISEGDPKEFLKYQLMPGGILGDYAFPIKSTELEMRENYQRIIREAKSIII